MLIAIGSARALPGRRDELVDAARVMVTASRGDGGCVSYGFFADLTDEDTIVSVEVWSDEAALESHMTHPHTADFLARSAALVDGAPTVTLHQVADPTDRHQ